MDLLKLASRDFTIHTGEDLGKTFGIKASDKDGIYAVFKVEEEPAFRGNVWKESEIWKRIKEKAEAEGSKVLNDRRSADPVVLSLRSLLKASP
jgi:hypothetical protein